MAKMRLTEYGQNLVLDSILGKTASFPDLLYLAVITELPTEASTGSTIVEPIDDPAYVRQPIDNSSTGTFWAPAASGIKINTEGLFFLDAGSRWESTLWAGLADAETDGNLILWGEWTREFIIDTGQYLFFTPGDMAVSARAPIQREPIVS